MKKRMLLMASACMATMVLTGCSLFEKANGIILYGDEEIVTESLDQEVKGQVGKENFSVKILETDGHRTLVMEHSTAKLLFEKNLLKEVEGDDAKAIDSLPEAETGEAILFAKDKKSVKNHENLELDVKYEGNIIIGDGRVYTDMFMIVPDADFETIAGTEKSLGIIEYDKDPDGIGSFGVDKEQLVRIGK